MHLLNWRTCSCQAEQLAQHASAIEQSHAEDLMAASVFARQRKADGGTKKTEHAINIEKIGVGTKISTLDENRVERINKLEDKKNQLAILEGFSSRPSPFSAPARAEKGEGLELNPSRITN